MDFYTKYNPLKLLSFLFTAVVLSACGGGTETTAQTQPTTVTISGTAAIGAAITEAEVTAKCANGKGFKENTITMLSGYYEGEVEQESLPCALRVSKPSAGITLHSFTETAGVANITPLTDMAISVAGTQRPEDWFSNPTLNNFSTPLTNAYQLILSALEAAGFTLPSDDYDPFKQSFTIGDSADVLLDAIQASIAASQTLESYSDLIDVVKDGNVNDLPLTPDNGNGSSETAIACFNPELYQQGSLVNMEHRITGANSTVTTDNTEYQVTSNDGSTVLIDQVVETYSAENTLVSTRTSTEQYSVPSTNGGDGLVTKTRSNYITTYTDSSVPTEAGTMLLGLKEDFRVANGEQFTSAAQIANTPDNGSSGTVWTFRLDESVTYAQRETLTVPAGEFSACRFDAALTLSLFINHPVYGTDTRSQYFETESRWYAVDSGILLKTTHSSGETKELVSASINGVDL
jgi:hypothetical protein